MLAAAIKLLTPWSLFLLIAVWVGVGIGIGCILHAWAVKEDYDY